MEAWIGVGIFLFGMFCGAFLVASAILLLVKAAEIVAEQKGEMKK